MTDSGFESLRSTFAGILHDLQLLQVLAADSKFSKHATNSTNGKEMARLLTDLADEVERTRPTCAIFGSLRTRSRKQEKHKILRLDVAKAEEEKILERLKKEQCRRFVQSFREGLPNFTPDDAVVVESDGLDWHLEVCKRLAGRVGMFVKENDVKLEEHGKKVAELEKEVQKEGELKQELMKEVDELDQKLEDVNAAATEGSRIGCSYCSMICQELGDQKSQPVVQEIESPEVLAPEGSRMSSEVHLLNPLTKELDGYCEEIEFTDIRTNSTKPGRSEKANQRSQNDMLGVDSKNHLASLKRQKPGTVTKVFVRRKTKDVAECSKFLGKETDVKLTDVKGEIENECKEGTGKSKHGENGAVESSDYQTKFLTLRETDTKLTNVGGEIENECKEGTRKRKHGEVESKEHQRNISTIKEEYDNSGECFKETGCASYYLTKSLELAKEYEFVEVKCGCTSPKDVDKTGILRIYKSGLLEIYCKCKEGCNKGKPMSVAAFEMHVSHGVKRNWKESIWIDMGHKVQLSKVKVLELYRQKYEEMNMKTSRPTCKTDSSILGKTFPEKRRLRPRIIKDCNIHQTTIRKTKQKSSKRRPNRWCFNYNFC